MTATTVGWRGQIDVDLTGVNDDDDPIRYVPVPGAPGRSSTPQTRAFDLSELRVIATVAVCDVDQIETMNTLPSISMKITQCVRLSDESLVRLDMDRGVTSVHHGAAEAQVISWKVPADDLIAEVLDLVRADDEKDPERHPWDELADAARKRGVDVDAATLSALPYQVLLSAEVVAVFVR
jgi:hypothetical protein